MSNIEQLKQKHSGEWLAIEVTKKDVEGPSEGDLVFHSVERKAVWKAIRGDRREIYVTFAGPLIDEGHAVAF